VLVEIGHFARVAEQAAERAEQRVG